MKNIHVSFERRNFRGVDFLFLSFPYDFQVKEYVKRFPGMKWSQSNRSFCVPFSHNLQNQLEAYLMRKDYIKVVFNNTLKTIDNAKISKNNKILPRDKEELMRNFENYLLGKRYSTSTLKVYLMFVRNFLRFHNNVNPELLSAESVRLFVEWVVRQKCYSISTHRQLVSALRHFAFFYPNCAIDPDVLERPQKQRKLPVVLSMEEVKHILQVTKNLKHKVAFALLYSSGLRVGELLNLELRSFDFDRRMIYVQSGKGGKDRYVQLAESLIPMLKTYYHSYGPRQYFLEGQKGGRYTASSIRAVLRQSCKLASITKPVTPHTLRHSYATHLMESGTGIRYIQELLGHSKPETTMIYTHVSSHNISDVVSPLDLMVSRFRIPEKSLDELSFGRTQFRNNRNKM